MVLKNMNLIKTSYSDNENTSFWVEYKTEKGFGYELIDYKDTIDSELSKEEFISYLMKEKNMSRLEALDYVINKHSITECSDYLQSIIESCRQSDNDMWFVEFDDEEYLENLKTNESFVNDLKNEIKKLNLEDEIVMGEDECHITVYGGVITHFIF